MRAPITIVDAFSDRPFAGNPAAVCVLSEPAAAPWMQSVAAEMNLSETAFLVPHGDDFDLRWFTPAVEVDLCGHATLASAHVLWESGRLPDDRPAQFHTRSGLLTAERRGETIELDFPAKPPSACDPPADLLAALGVEGVFIGQTGFDYFIVIDSAERVRRLKPDHDRLATLPVRGVIVTARSDAPAFDFISRFFAPGSGIAEDPVTGSAHCSLAPYWAERVGKSEMIGYQASKRGGVVRVRCAGERVKLAGKAVTVVRGEITA